ncbi:MAG TPA: tRNA (N6-isopentenyl adenosine(37)-C2)-methylthiotransferase MiaB [Actinomycetota bacterium]|nr:tRNA (N6-isopentenyl adenosine(37)-C2)-methylthiotransferase MiaB [Actinomycetota bacterium]
MEDRRYLIRTFGCQMNEHDSERIGGVLMADGMTPTDDPGDARVIVLNTCAIRENADNKLYGNLGHLKPLKDRRPDLRIVVAGCLAQKDQGEIQRKAPWVDVVVGTHALPHLLDLLNRAETDGPQMDVQEYTDLFPSALPAARGDGVRAWVSIATGCDNACTFCIVPFVRGAQRSRAMGDILAEVQGLAAGGVVEVTLLGQNVNTYGRDVTVPDASRRPLFADLLRMVNQVDGIERIRFTSPHPHDFTPDVIEAMATSEKVCEHIHFPLQSGSDRVLKAMQRSYRRERYLSWLDRIREAIPAIAVSTDIIVGFPGETEEDFADTLDAVERARFDSAYTFQYSPRPGTRAATMPDQVPKEVVQERFDRLVALQTEITAERNRRQVGERLQVLVEGDGKRAGSTQSRTRTNRIVHLREPLPAGSFATVEITEAAAHHLLGRVVEAPQPAAV